MRTSSVFQPTLPLRGATHEHGPGGQPQPASTHAPLAGSDVPRVELFRDLRVSTHAPLAGSDMPITSAAQPSPFCFNPRSPCGERRARRERRHLRGPVSTHAPLAGSDERGSLRLMRLVQFQPTLPLRGATRASRHRSPHPQCFNPRSPCGERRHQQEVPRHPGVVSTHAPLAGSDGSRSDRRTRHPRFNPRSPCGERRERAPVHLELVGVSTHAPLAGSDQVESRELHGHRVSTHAPLAGSDQTSYSVAASSDKFQPTLPLRGATFLTAIRNAPSRSFNPRSPCGERQLKTSCASSTTSFNPRSPCGERRCTRCPVGCRRPCFNPRSPCGERPMW